MNSFAEVLKEYNKMQEERRGCIKVIGIVKDGAADPKRDLYHRLMPVRVLAEALSKLDKDIEKFESLRVVEGDYVEAAESKIAEYQAAMRIALAAANQECSSCDGSGRCDAPQACPTWQAIKALEDALPKRRVEEDEDDRS